MSASQHGTPFSEVASPIVISARLSPPPSSFGGFGPKPHGFGPFFSFLLLEIFLA
jgi:hypothetical protein